MAEKGIKIEDATTGEVVACRDAVAQEGGEDRIIQIVDLASRDVVYQSGTPLRSSVSASDALDIDPLPAGISGGVVVVGDSSQVVVWGNLIASGGSTGSSSIVVTPVLLSEDATPIAVALGKPFTLRGVCPSGTNTYTDYISVGSADNFLTPAMIVPTNGCKKMAFHIHFDGDHSDLTLNLFAQPTSQGVTDALGYDEFGGDQVQAPGGGG